MKQKRIIGNWKMHGSCVSAEHFLSVLAPRLPLERVEVMLAVPFPLLFPMIKKGTLIEIGAQNLHDQQEGAYTGEVSGVLLREIGARFVLVGHSERRHLFQETDEMIGRKFQAAQEAGLLPVLCVGETQEEKASGKEQEVLARQLLACPLQGEFYLAYEPVWAIGTGKRASVEEICAAHFFIREFVQKEYGICPEVLYGGSVHAENAKELLALPEVDGVLVGGASLNPETFYTIIQSVH